MFGVLIPLLSLGFNPEFQSCVRLVLKAGELTGIFWHKMKIEIGEIEARVVGQQGVDKRQ